MSTEPQFTAAQIAACLDRTPQAIRKTLRDVPRAGLRLVSGKEAATWPVPALPASLRCELDAVALQRRYRNVEAMLSAPPKQWQPPLALNEIAAGEIERAGKLREALLPSLICQHDEKITSAEFEAAGLKDYARVFGHVITARRWRALFKRTLQRDGGAENINRLELYLSDNPAPKAAPSRPLSPCMADDFGELSAFIAACKNPHAPSEVEQRGIWTLAFDRHKNFTVQGSSPQKAARRVRDFLFSSAPFLAPTRNALRMAFERKLARWQEAGAVALNDSREENGASFALPEDDRDALIHRAVFYYRGDIAPAWRDLLRQGFPPEVVERYAGRAAKKSHVPASVMDSIGSEVETLTVMHRGKRAFDSIKGHVTRSYDGLSSLECFSGDDFTMNTYFYMPDGKGWFELTRGQVILFIDWRSSRILGWALEPRKSYSSFTIRSLCTHVFGEFGVPKVLYFERGIWKTATLLQGKTDPFTFTEISQGLREFGITFKHAIRPRTKTVERIGGMFQDIAEAEPGYCGRDERRDAPESLRKQMAEVAARKVHPSKYFYSLDQWNKRIGELVNRYNAEPQQGIICAGLSPDQAFKVHMNPCPPMQFSAGLRYLLAHDKRQARVTLNGVTIQVGKKKFNYRGQEIAHLVGRDVLAWFDPENPEIITVTNLDRTNPICVACSENPSVLESIIAPESGTLGRELARIEGQASHMKTRFNVIKAKFPLPQRQILAAAQVTELGEEIATQKAALNENAARRQRQRSQANKFAQRTGIAMAETAEPDDARRVLNFLNQKESQ